LGHHRESNPLLAQELQIFVTIDEKSRRAASGRSKKKLTYPANRTIIPMLPQLLTRASWEQKVPSFSNPKDQPQYGDDSTGTG
jgi:hypothetical protein